ncbi:MAG: DUF3825 domain-containing protein [Bacteroidota bacterium]
MPIGIVEFFNRSRGFGRIRTDHIPGGVFVHYSDVEGDAKILLENELVEFDVKPTQKGPKAKGVHRFGERLSGTITHYENGFGFISSKTKRGSYFLHHHDVMGKGFKRIAPNFQVEFSPFESDSGLQAKEVVITDTRPALERFARLSQWRLRLEELVLLAKRENWNLHPEDEKGHPILENYLYHTFARLEEEHKILYSQDQQGRKLSCFHTGLVTEKEEEIFAFFEMNKKGRRIRGYIKHPAWELIGFAEESHRLMSSFPYKPKLPLFTEDPAELIYDLRKRLVIDFDHIIDDHQERFPKELSEVGREELGIMLRRATERASFQVQRNFRMAVPQYYNGNIQLLLPLCLLHPQKIDLALVIGRDQEIYRANTIIPLDWAYQNARLIAPLTENWLKIPFD